MAHGLTTVLVLVLLAQASVSRTLFQDVCVLQSATDAASFSHLHQLLEDQKFALKVTSEIEIADHIADCHNLVVLQPSLLDSTGALLGHFEQHLDAGRNLLLLTNSSISSFVQDVATFVGYEFDNKFTHVEDPAHSHVLPTEGSINSTLQPLAGVVAAVSTGPLATEGGLPFFHEGVGLAAHVPNALLYPAIVAYPTAYSTDNDKDDEDDNARLAAGGGQPVVLLGCMQTRTGGRTCLSGSLSAFSDRVARDENYANGQVLRNMLGWVFGNMATGVFNNIQVQPHQTSQLQDGASGIVSLGVKDSEGRPLSCAHVHAEVGWQWRQETLSLARTYLHTCTFVLSSLQHGTGQLRLTYNETGWFVPPEATRIIIEAAPQKEVWSKRAVVAGLLLIGLLSLR